MTRAGLVVTANPVMPVSSRRWLVALLAATLACRLGAAERPAASDAEDLLKQARAEFAAADRNRDQQVTRDEFLAWCEEADRENQATAFGKFDTSGDGKLSRGEFFRFFSPTDERGQVWDPMAEGRAWAKWQAIFAAAAGFRPEFLRILLHRAAVFSRVGAQRELASVHFQLIDSLFLP